MVDRLAEDHLRAKRLAQQLTNIPGLSLEPGSPYTNMVYLKLAEEILLNAGQVAENLKAYGVLVGAVGERRFRLVTHYWISDEDVNQAVSAFREVLVKVLP
jgi:threonine aldolase